MQARVWRMCLQSSLQLLVCSGDAGVSAAVKNVIGTVKAAAVARYVHRKTLQLLAQLPG
jgi:hypothetical protein